MFHILNIDNGYMYSNVLNKMMNKKVTEFPADAMILKSNILSACCITKLIGRMKLYRE